MVYLGVMYRKKEFPCYKEGIQRIYVFNQAYKNIKGDAGEIKRNIIKQI